MADENNVTIADTTADAAEETTKASLNASNVPLLDDNNWVIWYTRMRLELGKHNATHLIDEVPKLDKDNIPVLSPKERVQHYRLIGMIGGRLSDGFLSFTVGAKTVYGLMKALKDECGDNGWGTESILFTKLCQVKYDPEQGTAAYIRDFRSIVQELQNTGRKLDNWIMVYLFFAGLGEEHASWATTVRQNSRGNADPPQLNTLTGQLKDEGRVLDLNQSDVTALLSQRRGNKHQSRSQGQGLESRISSGITKSSQPDRPRKPKKTCDNCGKDGHTDDDCWELYPEKAPDWWISMKDKHNKNDTNDTVPARRIGLMTMHIHRSGNNAGLTNFNDYLAKDLPPRAKEHLDSVWHIDSGATNHICADRTMFQTYRTTSTGDQVWTGAGPIDVAGVGNISLTLLCKDGSKTDVVLNEVLHVPGFITNLLSVKKLRNKHVYWRSDDLTLRVMRHDTEIGVAKSVGNLFVLQTTKAKEFALLTTHKDKFDWLTLHKRLGHLSLNNIKRLAPMVKGLEIPTDIPSDITLENCEACMLANSVKSVKHTPATRAKNRLDLVHIDLIGPITPTGYDGSKYGLCLTDDKTRATNAMVTKDKSGATIGKAIIGWTTRVHTQTGQWVKCFRADNGSEFITLFLQNWTTERGICWEWTTPYNPHQNGVSERLNRIVEDKLRPLMIDAGVDHKLWPLGFIHVVELKNRAPTRALIEDVTPVQAFTNEIPDLSGLKVWGCTAYVHIPEERRQRSAKWQNKAIKCIFVGCEGSGIYRLWDGKRVIRSKDVTFDESMEKPCVYSWRNSAAAQVTTKTLVGGERGPEESTSETTISDDVLQDESSDDELPDLIEDDGGDVTTHPQSPPTDESDEVTNQLTNELLGRLTQEPKRHYPQRENRRRPRLPHGQQYTAWLTTAYLSGYEEGVSDPISYAEAMRSPQASQWRLGTDNEFHSLNENNTWKLVPRPTDQHVLGGKWVFKTKRDIHGKVLKYKARWVVQGFRQEYGVDYDETYASVVKTNSYRVLLALATIFGWNVDHIDFVTAFLNGFIRGRKIYVEQPPGYEKGTNLVCELLRALYGLKQSPRIWYQLLHDFLATICFVRVESDHSIFVSHSGHIMIGIYVDDMLIAGPSKEAIQQFKQVLSNKFKMSDLGPVSQYLGIQITRNRAEKKMWLSQEAYVNKLLEQLGMQNCHGMDTPMEQGLQLTKAPEGYQAEREVIQWYQTVVGKLMYLLSNTRLDIAFAGSIVAKYSSNPTPEHVKAVVRIVRYLKKFPRLGITFDGNKPMELWGTVDSGWGEDLDTRKSQYGYMFFLAGGVISQCSKRQPTIALSSAEAEYYAAKEAAKEAVWLRALLKEVGYEQTSPTSLISDSESAIALASNPEHHARTKHVDIQTHWIRQVVASREIDLKWVSTKDQLADGLTKPLGRIMYQPFVRRSGLVDV